jgi:SAM-dependent methyltransferase
MMFSFWHSVPGAAIGHWLTDASTRSTAAGTAIYGPLVLGFIYDNLVLGLYCTLVWKCPAVVLEHLYRIMIKGAEQRRGSSKRGGQVQVRILDIGVATGYYMAKTEIPDNTLVALFDLNPNCLEYASARCRQAHSDVVDLDIEAVRGDFLASRSDSSSIHNVLDAASRPDGKKFDIIFTNFLLHCLPGPPRRKAKALAELSHLVEPSSGVLCGTTILGTHSSEANHSWLGRSILFWHNLLGWFDNDRDNIMDFVQALEGAFETVSYQVIGSVLFFEARSPLHNLKGKVGSV